MGSLGNGGALAIDPNDACGRERQALSTSKDYFTREIVVRAATGAVLGAAGGALIGGLAGLTAGAASGYYDKLRQSQADQQTLAYQVNSDLTTEAQQIDHTAATFASLRTCRFVVAQRIKQDARRGVLPRADAVARLDQQRSLFAQEVAVARGAGVNMRSRDDQFAYAAQSVAGSGSRAPAPVSRGRSRPSADPATNAKILATETVPQKRNSFEASVGNAEAQSKTAFNLDSSALTLNGPVPRIDAWFAHT